MAENDRIVFAGHADAAESIFLITDRGYGKKIPAGDIEKQNRAGKGQRIFAFGKDDIFGSCIAGAMRVDAGDSVGIVQQNGECANMPVNEIPMQNKQGTGQPLVLVLFEDVVTRAYKRLQS